ncbi:WXG100 family type VII secretion target [Streptomyces sp. NPDC050516]|uniref:WXG100 family type VII secretion target n=1 Tax=Streptomyces sp. NPDC050516 TaxID=3365621 RepID=UPI0037AD4C81
MTDSWVGGDIGGLRTMGEAYKKAKTDLESIVKPLSTSVDALAKDSGWQGESAESFRAKWTEDAMTAGGFAELVFAAGQILTDLADHLGKAEAALQNAEDVAVRAGVPMKPMGVPGELMTNTPENQSDAEKKALNALGDYCTVRNEILHTAQQARLDAAEALQKLYADDTSAAVSPGDKITVADYLRGLYAYDSERTRSKGHDAAKLLDKAKKEAEDARTDLRAERKAWQKDGKTLPKDAEARVAYKDALSKLDGLETDIARGEAGSSKLPYDHVLNTKIADVADTLRVGKSLESLPEFLKEIPVVDVAAASVCGLLEAKDDHDKGWSWTHSVVVDGGAALGGLAAGAGAVAGTLAAVGAIATSEVTVPVAVVAGVGGAVVIGATDLLDESFHEHWSEDIHDHGVLGGLWHGSGNVLSNTGDDLKRLGDDATGLGKKAWNGFKGLF